MTRSAKPTQAKTAKRNARVTARARPKPASMTFLVFEDNSGGYHWTIVAASGESLVQSASFASYEDAKQAARVVHAGAASASFEYLAGATGATAPVELLARRQSDVVRGSGVVRGDPDAERWLDEGGSFSSEAVTRWQVPR
jgi:uncharacterized protein YegP (UPF0339 family)